MAILLAYRLRLSTHCISWVRWWARPVRNIILS